MPDTGTASAHQRVATDAVHALVLAATMPALSSLTQWLRAATVELNRGAADLP